MSCLNQGKLMLLNRQSKNNSSNTNRFRNMIPGVETTKNVTCGNIEGFTGMMGENAANKANAAEAAKLNAMNGEMERALSEYANAKKVLMEETAGFINSEKGAADAANTSNRIGSVAGIKHQMKVVKWADDKLSVITDKGIVKPMSNDTWNEIKGKYGCPTSVEVNSGESLGTPIEGQMLGTNPNYFVGSNMRPQGCHNSSGINARVMSASDPKLGASEYAGAIRMSEGSGSQFEQQDDLTQPIGTNTKLDLCASRAVDLGRTGYAVYRDGDNVKCAIAPAGKKWNDIWERRSFASTAVTSDTIDVIDSNKYNSVSMLFDGRLAKTDIPEGKNLNVIESYDFKKYEQITSQKEDNVTDPTVASRIQLQSATYGANCNGQENKAATSKAQSEWVAHNISSGACSIQ